MSGVVRINDDHILLAVRLTPNGGRESFDGIEIAGNGLAHLKARVTAAPEKGKANKALIAMLAKAIKVAKSTITVASGETSRQKILRIDGDPEDLKRLIDALTSEEITWSRPWRAGSSPE
ncbi:MAG: DUF167 domain-containing protein [Allorhizobium sp.]